MRRTALFAASFATSIGVASSGCSGGLHTVPQGPRPENGEARAIIVATPPPPAKVEHVPTDPGGLCAWQDGQWIWLGGHWQWQPGAWVVPPVGCRYAQPSMAWVQAAQRDLLYYVH